MGTVVAWPVAGNPQDPDNWLDCDGRAVSQAEYPELYAVVGGNVPDYQGIFLRGHGRQTHSQNNGSNVGVTGTTHASGALGMIQGDAIRNIRGSISGNGAFGYDGLGSGALTRSGNAIDKITWGPGSNPAFPNILVIDASRSIPTATENRPINTAVRYLIRARP